MNHRIHTADSVDSVLERDEKVIKDDRVTFRVTDSREPTKTSPYDNDCMAFQV